ncbi:MAG: hypothetical protein IJ617_06230, partial [Oscillospiraceae bacterium]|nr:hypothetical protein [Oscillospiraceae bacterium]
AAAPGPPPRSLQEALGKAWREAGKAEQSYREAARRASDPEVRSLCAEAAEVKQRQRQRLRELEKRVYA